ncbi:MAG: hypothetical protein R2734_07125 [Nocardioides sp.]
MSGFIHLKDTPAGPADSDGDGITDAADACPTTGGDGSPTGCPDDDGDAVTYSQDRCRTERGEPGNQGCAAQTGSRVDVNRDGRDDLVHRWSQGVNTWLSKGDGSYTVKGMQAWAGYGYTDVG